MESKDWINNAKAKLQTLNVEELKKAGFIPKGSLYYPAIYYPPIPMYGASDEASILDGLDYDGSRPSSVYIHIPFCRSRCTYCHWVVNVGCTDTQKEAYIAALAKEMELWKEKFGAEKIYPTSMLIGGGTPTALSAKQLAMLFDALNFSLDFSKCTQITCETEPGSILGESGLDKLKVLRDQGVERISLGVQAFDDESLKEMGRVHSSADVVEAIGQARKAGFKSVSIDLIYGYPGCTIEKWLSSLETALALDVDAFQLYRLRIVPHGDKAGNIKTKFEVNPESFPSVEELYIMKMLGFMVAEKGGMNEASRRMFAKGRSHSSHYLLDHTDRLTDVIGFGASSWSNVQGSFYLNTGESLDIYAGYIDKGVLPINRGRFRTRDDEARWAVTLSLKHNGLSKELFKGLIGIAVEDVFPQQIKNLKKYGLIDDEGEKLQLTERGKFFADEVVMQFYHPDYLPFPESCYAAGELNPFSYSLPLL